MAMPTMPHPNDLPRGVFDMAMPTMPHPNDLPRGVFDMAMPTMPHPNYSYTRHITRFQRIAGGDISQDFKGLPCHTLMIYQGGGGERTETRPYHNRELILYHLN